MCSSDLGSVSYLAQDPEVEVPTNLQSHADRLGKVIASAQQQGVIDKLPIFQPYHLDQCGWIANRFAEAMQISAETKLKLLCETDPKLRLELVDSLMQES